MNVTIRKTATLRSWESQPLDQEARQVTQQYSPETLARAASFLYTCETRASFAIEGEKPSNSREERFFQALRELPHFVAQKSDLLRLCLRAPA